MKFFCFEEISSGEFDNVVVCTGHFSEPNIPTEYPLDNFDGKYQKFFQAFISFRYLNVAQIAQKFKLLFSDGKWEGSGEFKASLSKEFNNMVVCTSYFL